MVLVTNANVEDDTASSVSACAVASGTDNAAIPPVADNDADVGVNRSLCCFYCWW